MNKRTLFWISQILVGTVLAFVHNGNSVLNVSAFQRIVSPSSEGRTLFLLNVTYPYEARVDEDFAIYVQLLQGKNTNISVIAIQLKMPANFTQNLIEDRILENPTQDEILVVNTTLMINVQKRQRWSIGIWYSLKDLDLDGTWVIGSNDLGSFGIYPQTNDELTEQVSHFRNQVSDLQSRLWGLEFIAVYLTVALGLVLPLLQKRRKIGSSKPHISQE